MINLELQIGSSSVAFRNLFFKYGKTPMSHKFWELQIYRSPKLLNFIFQIKRYCDHSGVILGLGLLTFNIEFTIYDDRHWAERSANK